MGELLIPVLALAAEAVRAGADCAGAEFIDGLPAAGAAIDVDCAGSAGVVVGPLK
jgi:hypothetical protein